MCEIERPASRHKDGSIFVVLDDDGPRESFGEKGGGGISGGKRRTKGAFYRRGR